MVFPKQDSDGKHFPDILPKFIPLFNISTSLFLLSTQFIHTLNHLFVEQFKKTINILSFRPGYILDAARVIEQMIKIWEIHLIRKAQNDYNSISDNYMEMFDHQFQSRIQGVAGGDFSIIPASNVGEAFQSLPTTKLPFELLVSFLYEESWQHCSLSFTQQTIEEFELKNIMKSSSLKNNDNIAFTLGLNITDVLDNSKRSASPDIQHCYGKHPASPNKPAELIWIITFRRIYDKLRMVTSSFNFHHHGVNSNKLVTWIFDSPLLELLEQYLIQITFNQEDDETNVTGVVSLIVSIVLEIELLASKESRLPCEQWPKVQYMENVFMMFKIHWLDNGKFLEMIEDDIDDSRKVSIRRNTRGSSVSSPVPTSPHCYFVSKKEMFLLLETESAIWSNVLLNADMYQISTSTYDQGYVGNLDDEDEILTISTLDADNYQLV